MLSLLHADVKSTGEVREHDLDGPASYRAAAGDKGAVGLEVTGSAVDPGFYDAWVARGFNRLRVGDTAGARADANVAANLPSRSYLPEQTLLVMVDAGAGHRVAARQRVARMMRGLDLSRPGPLPGSLVAWALLAVGDREQALALLERVQPRGASLWFWLRAPGFDSVRSQSRFRRIVEESQR